MKKFKTTVLLLVLAAFLSVSLFSCYGNFTLTRKLYEWNGSLGDKYINNIVFWILFFIPAYEFTVIADFFVLNTIEFWTGTNPMSMNEGQEVIKYAQTDDASFKITITKNNIAIDELTGKNAGQSVLLSFDEESQAWYLVNDGNNVKIATLDGDKMNLIYPSGNTLTVDLMR
ncbi:MAG TPA: DUF3332 domain-containing protein [Candidatus Cloacimonadota bacterium]|jgi:hypothetical protein|nr:DUF3332 domain-containing protein [Candidatus Cloacimonadota bacterium]HOF59392.1 DUF3332 domain-containing protein [Candidatus Cloacimonadota bacterium]HOR58542.1 DUF3332 domain-containing protein [Candidatus Cloacimonadota bacterium]HPB09009.1 DUF3332 domain-containing protein [Candidatus Cloacimonadota bacterium]HQL12769.1 DUF3332 domain-containing protein [Candidatus Cloacimonadota bacterium]